MENLRNRVKPEGDPEDYNENQILEELELCFAYGIESFLYFTQNYVHIQDNDAGGWVPFKLWDTDCKPYQNQVQSAIDIATYRYVLVLKARQVGVTWICLAYILWSCLFFPVFYALMLSKGEDEGEALNDRMSKMIERLPSWMRPELVKNNKLEIEFASGSYIKSDNPRGGDSRTFNIVLVDEADLIYRSKTTLHQTLLNVEPTIGTKGQLILVSKSDKNRPSSTFKALIKAARKKMNNYKFIFIPWWVNPRRTNAWHKEQKQKSLSIDGTLDTLHESYPSTPQEALRGKSANKRLPYYILKNTEKTKDPAVEVGPLVFNDAELLAEMTEKNVPLIQGLRVYKYPEAGKVYVLGGDPAEGLMNSDPSGLCVVDYDTLELCAVLNVRADPELFASHIDKISKWYNGGPLLYENNNHGHALRVALRNSYQSVRMLHGWTATGNNNKPGWNTNTASKSLMYDTVLQKAREAAFEVYDEDVFNQLISVDQFTLKAPQGENDDLAIAFSLCVCAKEFCQISFDLSFVRHSR